MFKALSVILIGLSLVACGKKPQVADNTLYVKMYTLGSSSDHTQNTFHGVIHAEFEPNLSFRVNGKIITRNVDIGQEVKKGTVLANLDPTDYRLSADSANAQLAAAKSNFVTQKANLERYRQLLTQNFVSQAQFDTQKAQFESARSQYDQAANQLANSQNQVKYTSLLAPADGVISSISMDAGQVVSSGATVATMAVSGNQEVEIELPETQINDYKIGMPATIKIWATNQNYLGKIRIINQASDQQTRTFTARISILKPDDQIKYGMSADVTIEPLNNASELTLPLNSLYAKSGKSYVWLVDQNSRAKLIPIQVIWTNGSVMEIESTTLLHKGDTVVSAGANLVYAGQALKKSPEQ